MPTHGKTLENLIPTPPTHENTGRPPTLMARSSMTPFTCRITAIVVCRNEAHLLEDCLQSLRWVDELLVVNMESSDNTLAIASRWADKILSHPVSPIVEPVRCFAAQHAHHPWLLFVDPDERYPKALAADIRKALPFHTHTGILRLPMKYYFKRKPLNASPWGKPTHYRPALVHRQRCTIKPLICRGFELKAGYTDQSLHATRDNHIRHEWMDSYGQLFHALKRYAPKEGESRYLLGERFNWRMAVYEPLRELKISLLARNGLKEGLKGLILSFAYSAYQATSAIYLLANQIRPPRPIPVQTASTNHAPSPRTTHHTPQPRQVA